MTMPIPDGSVVITPSQMYQQIGELTNEVKGLRAAIDPAVSDIRQIIADHETRLRTQEARRTVSPTALGWSIGVALTALGLLITFLALYHPAGG